MNGDGKKDVICSTAKEPIDENGHGTHVAGTAAGTCYGVASQATIHGVKVIGKSGGGEYSTLIAGLSWIKSDIERLEAELGYRPPAVINMSVGGGTSQALDDAVNSMVKFGVPVIVAAGNNFGADACRSTPASAQSAFVVASTEIDDSPSSFSNVGPCVDIWAPGSSITSASAFDMKGSRVLSGTSMATPAVTGLAALILESNPSATPEQVYAILKSNAVQKQFVQGTTNNFANI